MDQTDPARDPLRQLAEAALARQEAGQRQRADDQAAVDRDQAAQAEAADQAQTLAEAQQLAAEVFGAEGAELAAGLTWTAVGTGQATATIDDHVLVYHRTPILWTRARAAHSPLGGSWWPTSDGTRPTGYRKLGPSLGLLCAVAAASSSAMPPSPAWRRRPRCCAALTRAARGTPGTPTTHIRGP